MDQFPPFGYKFPKDCKTALLLDSEAAKIVRFIFERYLEGMYAMEIARLLNEKNVITPTRYLQEKGYKRNLQVSPIWTYTMVRNIVTNPLYTGTIVNHRTENRLVAVKSATKLPREQWICVQGTHAAIVSQEEFDRVMEIWRGRISPRKKKSGRKPEGEKTDFKKPVLSGKIKCGYCKRKVRIRDEQRNVIVRFFCSSVRASSALGCYDAGFPMAVLEELVLTLVKKQAALAEDAIKAVTLMNQTVDSSKLKRKKKTLEEKETYCKLEKMELYEKYVAGDLTREEYLKQKSKLSQKENEYKEKISEIQNTLAETSKQKESYQELKGIAKYADLEALSRPIVEELIETIYFYDPEHIEVIWKFQDEWLKFVEHGA